MSWVVTAYLLTQTIATILGGKFGDLFGRKTIFVGSIVLFTVASTLAGLSQSMTWLIGVAGAAGHRRRRPDRDGDRDDRRHHPAARPRQVPGRDRRRLRSHDGPRTAARRLLHRPPVLAVGVLRQRADRARDHPARGQAAAPRCPRPVARSSTPSASLFISVGSAALILATSWGGTQYALGLADDHRPGRRGRGLPRRASSSRRAGPSSRSSRCGCSGGTCSASASCSASSSASPCSGAMTFLPTYLQYCQGVSATVSGLRTLPMVLGLIVASVSAGNVVSHTGRYRVFPIVGSRRDGGRDVAALASRRALHDPGDLAARCSCSASASACRCRC